VYQGSHLSLLVLSWLSLGCSMLAGVVGMGGYISQYAESDIRPRRSAVEYCSLVQVLALMLGLTLLAIFAVQNASNRTQPSLPPPVVPTSIGQ
jgi:hypothetical protein